METRKIASIIFLVSLIFLSLGMVVYIVRQRSVASNLQSQKLSSPPASSNSGNLDNSATASSTGIVTKEGKSVTEEQIQTKIVEKQNEIKKKTSAKEYTNDELIFLSAPRQAVINELKAGK